MTTQEKLIKIYERAEKRLRAIILKKGIYADGSVYYHSLLRQISAELKKLRASSAAAVNELVTENYTVGLKELLEELSEDPDVSEATGTGENISSGTAISADNQARASPQLISAAQLAMSGLNKRQIEVIARNATADFNKAISMIGRRAEDIIREITLETASEKLLEGQTLREMQKSLEKRLEQENITSVTYKNGTEMPLKSYAEMAARSTTAEAQNAAKTAQGTEWGYDLVRMTAHSPTCAVCAMYQGRVYATTKEAAEGKYKLSDGTVLKFPYLYETAFSSGYQTIHPRCRHRISVFPPRAYTDEELRRFSADSCAPFEDTRSDRERKAYAEDQAKKRKRNEQRKEYERIKAVLPDQAPKSFSGFIRMKTAKSSRYMDLMEDYRYVMKKLKESGG